MEKLRSGVKYVILLKLFKVLQLVFKPFQYLFWLSFALITFSRLRKYLIYLQRLA